MVRQCSFMGRRRSKGPPAKEMYPHSSCQNVIERPRYARAAATRAPKMTIGMSGRARGHRRGKGTSIMTMAPLLAVWRGRFHGSGPAPPDQVVQQPPELADEVHVSIEPAHQPQLALRRDAGPDAPARQVEGD